MFLLVANYKTNGDKQFYLSAFKKLNKIKAKGTKLVLCPPFCYLPLFNVNAACLGSQDICSEENGKSTGQISAKMLKEFGVKFCLVGHSERRKLGETDEFVALKVKNAVENQIVPIVCVGENVGEKQSVIKNQVKIALTFVKPSAEILFAYEPVWAIGTGNTPTTRHVNKAVETIKKECSKLGFDCKILYGGSINGKNYKEFLNCHIDGFLLGAVSLKTDEFIEIVKGIK